MNVLLILAIPIGCAVLYTARHLAKDIRQKRRRLKLADTYHRFVLQNRFIVDHSEVIGNRLMALDRKNKKLIVIDYNGKESKELCIPLLSVSATRIVEEKNEQGLIERIMLELKLKISHVVYSICFFDHAHDPIGGLRHMARKAQHWKNRVDVNKYPGSVNVGTEYVL